MTSTFFANEGMTRLSMPTLPPTTTLTKSPQLNVFNDSISAGAYELPKPAGP